LILLDEPFITLDVKTVVVLRNLIAQQSAAGVSFLISSHQDLELPVSYRSLHVAQQTIQPEPHAASAQ
jgi:ABC-type transport system involved in cytochrome c biogenesis ATPase subunit